MSFIYSNLFDALQSGDVELVQTILQSESEPMIHLLQEFGMNTNESTRLARKFQETYFKDPLVSLLQDFGIDKKEATQLAYLFKRNLTDRRGDCKVFYV